MLTRSVEGRRIDLITITDCSGASTEDEPATAGCFPDSEFEAPCALFHKKKVGGMWAAC